MKKALRIFLYIVLASVLVVGSIIFINAKSDYDEYSSRPALPVSITFRTAVFDNGLVAEFKNINESPLSVLAVFENPTLNKKSTYRLNLPALNRNSPVNTGSIEFGHMQGWSFYSGDKITLYHDSFKNLNKTVP